MRKFILFILLFTFIVSSDSISASENSKLYFKSPEVNFAPGSEIVVGVFLDSTAPINAFDLVVNYPEDKLEFLNSDNTGSIVNIWQTKPSLTEDGKVSFSGGILKAFSGTRGFIINLSFRVLEEGKATLIFTKSDLYLANGKGTKIEPLLSDLSLEAKKNSAVVSTPITPFQDTKENIIIEQELENYESNIYFTSITLPLLVLVILIFVILALAVYNKRKRKL
jgi:hypothetical protein